MNHTHVSGGVLDYQYIAEGIYIGSNQCCMLGIVEVLQKEGVSVDISLEAAQLDQPFGVEAYLWLPTPDHMPPTQDQIWAGIEMIDTLIKRNKKIYVHCKNGHGRAPTLVAAYFIQKGKTVEEAEEFIKSKRLSVHLQESQKKALQVFWKTLDEDKRRHSDGLFTCSACGLRYHDEKIAKQCQAWCEEHHSCNLDIIKHANQ